MKKILIAAALVASTAVPSAVFAADAPAAHDHAEYLAKCFDRPVPGYILSRGHDHHSPPQ